MTKVLAALLPILLAVSPIAAEQLSKTVRDWTGLCDDNSCTAEVTGAGGMAMGQTGYRFRITRRNGAGAGWSFALIAHNVAQPDGPGSVTFSVDGAELPPAKAAAYGDFFAIPDASVLRSLFPALKKGQEMTLSFNSAGGEARETFSLSGLAAVLLWIDERQGRVGDSEVVSGEFQAPPTELITDFARLPKPLYELLKLTTDCSPEDNDYMLNTGISRDWLEGGAELYSVPCWTAAYNTIERYFTVSGDAMTPLLFADYSDTSSWTGTAEMINSGYDPARRELSSLAKGRGLGDCGSSGLWRRQDGMFRMIEYRYQPECGGAATSDPEAWPLVYEAKQGD